MKKQVFAALIAVAGMSECILQGIDIPVVNNTPFKIVKCQLEDSKEKLTDMNLDVAAKTTKKVSFPDKGVEEVCFFFENGMKISPYIEEFKDVRKFELVYKDEFTVSTTKRSRRTKYPEGQVRVRMAKEIKSFSICPVGKNDEWKQCPVVDAKQQLYSIPASGKYLVKIVTTSESKPELIFDNEGAGFDFKQNATLSLSYTGLEADAAEEDDEDDDEEDDDD